MKRLKGSLTKEQNKIIIDFNGIKHLSPKAAQLLVMKNVEKLSKKRNQIEVRNFQEIATGAFTNITNLISDGESSEEGSVPSQEIESQTFYDHLS